MTDNEPSREELRDLAVDLAGRAGAELEGRRVGDLAGTRISGTELVADVARASGQVIFDGLAAYRPGDVVVVEGDGSQIGSAPVRWIVNPLDGKLNYSHGLPSYGVSLAAELEGVVVTGAVYSAPLGTVYDAVLGGGARADGEAIRCTSATDLALSLIATGFSDSLERRTVQAGVVGELLPEVGNLRRIGPATLDLCAVGAGHLDGFFELGLEAWDCAAGLLVAAEAGARTGTVGTPWGQLVMAAAPDLYEQLATALRRLHVTHGDAGLAGAASDPPSRS